MTNSALRIVAAATARQPKTWPTPASRLTAETCHELSNLLGAIVLNLESVKAGAPPARADHLENALSAACLASALMRDALNEARSDAPAPTDISETVSALGPLLRSVIGPNIDLFIKSGPQASFALIDPVKLRCALLNLAINARDAMPDGGILTVECCFANVQPDSSLLNDNFGEAIVVTVADNGVGMPQAMSELVTEPFFTTKPAGKGSGLGLSIVRAFAEGAGGYMKITSAPDCGTAVHLVIPRLSDVLLTDEAAACVRTKKI